MAITLGPGAYEHERGDSQVKDRAYQALIQPVQAVSPANPGSPGPGDYEEIRRFGDEAEVHTIGMKRD
jgi:hypothetical protein